MKNLLAALVVLVTPIAFAQRAEPSPAADRSRLEPPALEQIRKAAVSFRADVPTSDELKPLIAILQSARVIGVGESTHGDLQSQTFKGHLIRELVKQSAIDSVVFEINRAAGAQIDAYVNEGKGDFADVFVNGGIFSIWRTDEMASLLGWLRAYVLLNKKSIRIYGVDCQDPALDLAEAIKFLQTVDRKAAGNLRKLFAELIQSDKEGKTYYAWVKSQAKGSFGTFSRAVLEAETLMLKNQGSWQKRTGYSEARYCLRTAWQALHSFEFEFGPDRADYSKVSPDVYSRRDRYMAANLLARVGDKGKAALWAHDAHVLPVIPEAYAAMGVASLGSTLRKEIGDAYRSIGFTWSRGAVHAKLISAANPDILAAQQAPFQAIPLISDRPGDLGEFLGRVGPDRFYLDLRNPTPELAAWGKLGYYVPSIGFALDPAIWLSTTNDISALIPSHDILVYHRHVSPSSLWIIPRKPKS